MSLSHCLEGLSSLSLRQLSLHHRSLSGVVPFGTSQVREFSTAARRRAAGIVPELIHTDLLPSLCWIGDQEGVIEHRMHVIPRRPIAVSGSL